jgi:tight adherence protein B
MTGAIDTAIILASVSGLAILLLFVGFHQVAHREVSLADRLSGWGLGRARPAEGKSAQGWLSGRVEGAVAKQSFASAIQRDLARANLRLTVSEYLMIHAGLILGGLIIGTLLRGVIGGVPLAILGFFAPRLFVGMKQRKRIKAFNSQLADALMLMSNSLRAGYSLLQSMETVAREGPEPTAEEFGRVVREVGLGLTPENALVNLHRRLPSEDLDLMVTAINVQHEVGGNLAKIFDTLGETIRERTRIKGEIQTLTAQQRLGGNIIACLPLFLAGAMFLMNPSYFEPLMTSRTLICMPGFMVPILTLLMIAGGWVSIRRLVAIEV